LTISLKGHDGNDLSSTNLGYVAFRNSTAATGTPVVRELSSAASLTISSGSTLGHKDATDHYIYVYLLDNAGSVVLAVSGVRLDEGTLQSSTAEGGAGGADDIGVLYSGSGLSSKAIRLVARLKSNQTTAGTWAVVPTEISLTPFIEQEVSFSARRSTSDQDITTTSATTMIFNKKYHDTHNAYNDSTGEFTAPLSGYYLFTLSVQTDGQESTSNRRRVYFESGGVRYGHTEWTGFRTHTATSALISLSKGDVVTSLIECPDESTPDYNLETNSNSVLSGFRIGGIS
jgi:hypothetical protein